MILLTWVCCKILHMLLRMCLQRIGNLMCYNFNLFTKLKDFSRSLAVMHSKQVLVLETVQSRASLLLFRWDYFNLTHSLSFCCPHDGTTNSGLCCFQDFWNFGDDRDLCCHLSSIFTSPTEVVAKYCDEYVCLSICPWGYLRNHMQSFPNVLHMFPMAVARSSSGIVAIHYVLPVSRMTSCCFLW